MPKTIDGLTGILTAGNVGSNAASMRIPVSAIALYVAGAGCVADGNYFSGYSTNPFNFVAPVAAGSRFVVSGSPESAVNAAVGATCVRSDGGAGTTLYVKESGTGNTGWAAK